MTSAVPDMQRWAPSIEPFAAWINRNDFAGAKLWACALKSANPDQIEGAIAEAVAWDWLSNRVDEIRPARTGTGPSPDFRCRVDSEDFFVEVTNISRASMTGRLGFEDAVPFTGFYRSPSDRLHGKISSKAKQGRALDRPFLVFVTTLHRNGSVAMSFPRTIATVLHGKEFLQAPFDPDRQLAPIEFENVTDFRRAAFTRSQTLDPERAHVSGALFGPFGLYPSSVDVLGILNPDASHPLDPLLLPGTPFARFSEWPPEETVEVEWTAPVHQNRRRQTELTPRIKELLARIGRERGFLA